MTFSGPDPQVAGHPAASAAQARAAVGRPSPGAVQVERSDTHLVSVVWRCGTRILAATATLDGRRLALGDILTGSYQGYLSSVAASQFSVEGIRSASTSDLSTWYLTPAALAVAFPAGVVSYPLSSLTPYLKDANSV